MVAGGRLSFLHFNPSAIIIRAQAIVGPAVPLELSYAATWIYASPHNPEEIPANQLVASFCAFYTLLLARVSINGNACFALPNRGAKGASSRSQKGQFTMGPAPTRRQNDAPLPTTPTFPNASEPLYLQVDDCTCSFKQQSFTIPQTHGAKAAFPPMLGFGKV